MSIERHDIFWTPDRIDTLQTVLHEFATKNGFSAERICAVCADSYQSAFAISESSARRFIREKSISKLREPRALSGLLDFAKSDVKPWLRRDPSSQERLALAVQLDRIIKEYEKDAGLAWPIRSGTVLEVPEVNKVVEAIELVSINLKLDPSMFPHAADNFVRGGEHLNIAKDGAEENHFVSYRYSATPGVIAKSFTFVRKPIQNIPLARFGTVLPHAERDRPRIANGMLLPFGNMTLFIGEIDDGAAAKLIVFTNPSVKNRILTGVLLTLSNDNSIISSKFLMKRILPIKERSPKAHEVIEAGFFKDTEIVDPDIEDLVERLNNSPQDGVITDAITELQDLIYSGDASKKGAAPKLSAILKSTGRTTLKV